MTKPCRRCTRLLAVAVAGQSIRARTTAAAHEKEMGRSDDRSHTGTVPLRSLRIADGYPGPGGGGPEPAGPAHRGSRCPGGQPGPPGGGRAAGLLRPRSRSRADEAAAAGRPPGERNGP